MKTFLNNWKTHTLALMASGMLLFSCNKDLPEAVPTPYVPPAGSTIMSLLDGPNFTILKAAVTRAGLTTALNTPTNVYTVFAPDDAAFQASGFPSPAVVNLFRPGQLDSVLRYHLIGGQAIGSTQISDRFPNNSMQSMLMVANPSAALPPGYRLQLGVSRRGNNAWANNAAVKQANIQASNGVVHIVDRVIFPPDSTIAQIVANNPSYSYLLAALVRADSGFSAPNRLIDALGNSAANFTLMAPTDLAFQQTLTFLITQALIGQGMDPVTAQATATVLASSPAVFSNPALFGALSATTVRGILAYHVIGRVSANPQNTSLVGRAFGVNIPGVLTDVNTLLVIPPTPPSTVLIPPIPVKMQNTGGVITVKGLGNATPATVTTADKNTINGVIHRINGVLFPQ
jgi:uncharacterized surface protein with fasciclin (FAS1) repeats